MVRANFPFHTKEEICNEHVDIDFNIKPKTQDIIRRCLQKDPEKRPSLRELLSDPFFLKKTNTGSSLDSSLDSSLNKSLDSLLNKSLDSSLDSGLGSSLDSSLDRSLDSSLGNACQNPTEESVEKITGSSLDSSLDSSLGNACQNPTEESVEKNNVKANKSPGEKRKFQDTPIQTESDPNFDAKRKKLEERFSK